MNHPPAHADRILHDHVSQTRARECLDASGADGKIDGTPCSKAFFARITTALDEFDTPSRASEIHGEKTSCESRSDDEHTRWLHASHRTDLVYLHDCEDVFALMRSQSRCA